MAQKTKIVRPADPRTRSILERAVRMIIPGAQIERDLSGQLLIYTGLWQNEDGTLARSAPKLTDDD